VPTNKQILDYINIHVIMHLMEGHWS